MLELDIQAYRLPFRRPFVTAFSRLSAREGWIVRIRDTGGLAGLGEAAPLPGFGGGEPAAVERALAGLAPRISSLPGCPGSPAELAAVMAAIVEAEPALALEAPAALAAVDLALADLAARRAGLPLARWLAPAPHGQVQVNATIGGDAPAACARAASEAIAEGFKVLKLKLIGRDADDLARVAAVRAVAEGIAIRLDANGSWSLDRARTMLSALGPFDIEYVEQPTPVIGQAKIDVQRLAQAKLASRVPVAADEILLSPEAAQGVLEQAAADLLILKPALLGGLSTASKLATQARRQGLEVVVTSALDTAVGRLGALHLAAALAVDRACGLATGDLLARDLAAFPRVRQGALELPVQPGLGLAAAAVWTGLR